jgi:hypothetical protein
MMGMWRGVFAEDMEQNHTEALEPIVSNILIADFGISY